MEQYLEYSNLSRVVVVVFFLTIIILAKQVGIEGGTIRETSELYMLLESQQKYFYIFFPYTFSRGLVLIYKKEGDSSTVSWSAHSAWMHTLFWIPVTSPRDINKLGLLQKQVLRMSKGTQDFHTRNNLG